MGKKKGVIIDDSVETKVTSSKSLESSAVIPSEVDSSSEALAKLEGSQDEVKTDSRGDENDKTTGSEEIAASPKAPRNDGKKADKKSKAASKKEAPKKANRSTKYKTASESSEKSKKYNVTDAVERTKAGSYSKFDGTIEVHMNTNNKNMRGLVSLPFASGRKLTVLAFGKGAEESGADMVGDDEKISSIQKGKVDFDVVVTTADWMPKLAKIAAILGPRGLMPNPKSGTITTDLKRAVTDIQSGKVEYKTDRNAQTMHLSIGKVSQNSEEIVANVKTLVNSIGKTRIKKVVLAPTMGPGVKVDMSSL